MLNKKVAFPVIEEFILLTLSENFLDSSLEAFRARAAGRELRVEILKVTIPNALTPS